MKSSDKIRIAVLFGGRSAEHEVSLRSAKNVIQHLDPTLFDVVPIGIDKSGNWLMGDNIFEKSLAHTTVTPLLDDHSAWFTPEWIGKATEKQLVKNITHKQDGRYFDVIFPVVHGTFCEDGTLQGLLELAGVPYVGCGVLASAIGMDKDVSKRLVMNSGINVVPYLAIKHDQWQQHAPAIIRKVSDTLSYPVFVKPVNTGSSIGITKVKTPNQLSAAIQEAFKFDTKILIEKALTVHELEVAVLESLECNADPIVSVVGEIKTRHEFYSYEAKYLDENGAELCIPATVSTEIQEMARTLAKDIFSVLNCEGMARVDLFFDTDSKKIFFNEINTIPGFTQISMYPKLMNASGISYPDLLTHLIQLAMKRHQNKSHLIHSYAD